MEVKYSVKALVIFEKIADKPFEVKSITDFTLLAYSCYLAAGNGMTFNEFLDWIEANPKEYMEMSKSINQQMELDAQLNEEVKDSSKKK